MSTNEMSVLLQWALIIVICGVGAFINLASLRQIKELQSSWAMPTPAFRARLLAVLKSLVLVSMVLLGVGIVCGMAVCTAVLTGMLK